MQLSAEKMQKYKVLDKIINPEICVYKENADIVKNIPNVLSRTVINQISQWLTTAPFVASA